MKKRSNYGKVDGADMLNALYHAFIAAAGSILGFLSKGKLPETTADWYIVLGVFLTALLGDVSKRTFTNSDGNVLKREVTKTK